MRRALRSIRSAFAVTVKSKQSSKPAKQAAPAVKQAPKVTPGGMLQRYYTCSCSSVTRMSG